MHTMALRVAIPVKECTTQKPTLIKRAPTSPLMESAHITARHLESLASACLIGLPVHTKPVCTLPLAGSAYTWLTVQLTNMTISELTGLLGLIFGLIGTSIGVFNFWRDKGRLVVRLQWDMAVTGEPDEKRVGCITVTNTGRRAIFMSHVALRLPKGGEYSHFLIRKGLKGQKLSEGDPPAVFRIDQECLGLYANEWKNVRAQVSDSTGKEWISKNVTVIPSWANNPKISLERDASPQNGSRSSP